MKVICIGNYPPRQCGIATFTENLVQSILHASKFDSDNLDIEVIAMNDGTNSYSYPKIVGQLISDRVKDHYLKAAEYINQSGAMVCLVQHEYGIYGGESGLLLLAALRKISIPIVSTLHTVLENPTFHQQQVLQQIAHFSSRIVVMNGLAIRFLVEVFGVDRSKIVRIQHGVPDFDAMKTTLVPVPETWKGKRLMMTFGLIGRSKGIETVLRALPAVIDKNPDLLYVILGKTHPSIVKYAGEEYREYLEELVQQHNLQNNVAFVNRYVSEEELVSMLQVAELYVTPYLNKAQITSGTLSYAVGAGCAVLSTPYWHAEELLADDRGLLFGFGDHSELSQKINLLLKEPERLIKIRRNAFDYGKTISWPLIGNSYLQLFKDVIQETPVPKVHPVQKIQIEKIDFTHLKRLTDSTGLLQHARFSIPYYRSGYCLDDNARAIILCMTAYRLDPQPVLIQLLHVYLAYFNYMQQKDGTFRNYLTYERSGMEDDHSDDAFGRAIWATGTLIRYAPDDALFQIAHQLFSRSVEQLSQLRYARGFANGIFGIYQYIKRFPDQERFQLLLEMLSDKLCDLYYQRRHEGWDWFEESITYDNGLLPGALYRAYEITRKEKYLEVAEASRSFLESKCFREDWLSLIGNRKWLRMDDDFDLFAQQPIDALSMVILYDSAFWATSNKTYINKLLTSYTWFTGYNDLNISVYDSKTKGCNDGIEEFNVNRNQGAESTIAFLLAQCIVKTYLHEAKS